jgi:type VI secretion system protein VasG
LIAESCEGASRPDVTVINEALRRPLLQVFPAALLGRMIVIPYYPLNDEMLANIVRLQLGRVEQRVRESYAVPFGYDPSVVDLIASRCTELESGGRAIDAVLTGTLLPELSRTLLLRTLESKPVERVSIGTAGGEFSYTFE